MEQNFTPLHQASNTNLKRIGIVLCGLVCILIGVIIWFMYTGNTAFLSEKADLQRDIDSRMAELSADLKKEQQNSLNQKFEDLTKVLTSLIDQKEEEYADPFLSGETEEANPTYLSITSENLIRNSSFESGENKKPRQWEYILESNNANSIQSQETVRSGKFSMEFVAKDAPQLGISQPVTKTIPGRTYNLSLYIKTQHIDQGTTLRLGFWNEYTNTYAAMDEIRLSSNTGWYRVSTTQKTSGTISDWTNWYPVIEIRNHISGSVFIDDVQLTEGEILIDYSSILAGSPGNTISSIIGNGSVYVTSSGSVFPAENGIGSLGTNANRWEEIYLTNATITKGGDMDLQGSLSIDDNLIVKGDTTFIDNSIFKGGINVGEHNEFTVNSEGDITSIHGITYSFPNSQGAPNEILINDGNGNLTWGTFGSASVTPDSLDFAQIADALTLDDDTSIDVYDGTLDNNFQIYNSNTSTEIAFFDGSSGNIGFGTVTPSYKVDINGALNTTSLYLSGSQVTSSASELNYLDGTSVLAGGVMFGNGTRIAQDPANFYWNDSSNRLGIGNTDPQFTLDVNGDVRVRTGFDFYIGAIGLNDTGISRTTSGASRIGTFDEFTNSASLNVQDVLDDLDAAITTFASGAGDIEAVGSMTSGSAFADLDADDQWLGLGMNAGRIEFDNEAINEINILSAYLGVGSTTPSALLSVGEGNEFTVDVSGNLSTAGTITGASINTGQGAYEIQDASTANKGLASFNSSHFSVSSGAVSIATGGVGPTELASTSVTAGTYGAVGGTAAYIPQITVDQDGRITAASSLPFALNFETPLSFQNGLTRTSNTIELGGSLTKDTRLHIGNTEAIFIDFPTGNVGVGLATPGRAMDIVRSGEGLNAVQLRLGTSATTYWEIGRDQATGDFKIIEDSLGPVLTSLQANGNIGIGTTSPTQKLDVNGNIIAAGSVTGTSFSGSGANLTALNASQLTTGTVPNARISGSYTGIVGTGALNAGSITSGFGNINIGSATFTGNGSGLTNLNASQLTTGTISDARITGSYTGLTNLSGSGTVTFGAFSGSGVNLTSLNASQLATGTVPSGRISGSYTGIVGTGALNAGSITSGFGNINIGTATFTGNGSGITNLNASQLSTGTIPDARIGGAYTGITNLSTTGTLTLAQNASDVLNFSASTSTDTRGISFNGRTALSADSSDGYLRLNQGTEFTNGVYTGGPFRADGGLTAGNYTSAAGEVRANLFRDGTSGYYIDPSNTATSGLFAGKVAIGIGSTHFISRVNISSPGMNGIRVVSDLYRGIEVYTDGDQGSFYNVSGTVGCHINAINNMMSCSSDARLKKNIISLNYGLKEVNALRGVSFNWNFESESSPRRLGFIAQEIESVLPELVTTQDDGYKSLNYMNFAPVLVNAINEQQDLFDDKYNSLTLADASLTSRVNLLTIDLNKLSGKTADILGMQKEVTSLDEEMLYQGQQIASLQNQMDEVFSIINKEEVASEEANIASLTERVSFLEKLLGAETVSASTGEEEVEEEVDTTVMENLTVTDKINTFDLGVVGDINAGQVVIHGRDAQINSLTKALEIQSEATNPVEIMGGKVTIETNGSLTVKESVTAKKYNVDDNEEESASIGEATLKAGETEIVIKTTSVTESSKIFLTPTKETDMQLAVVEKERGKSFTVKVVKEAEQDISFNWWIVN